MKINPSYCMSKRHLRQRYIPVLECLKRFGVKKREKGEAFSSQKALPLHGNTTLPQERLHRWSFHCINYSVTDCLEARLDDRMLNVKLQDLTQFHFKYGNISKCSMPFHLKLCTQDTIICILLQCCISATGYISKITKHAWGETLS